jgi:hypothetical protein
MNKYKIKINKIDICNNIFKIISDDGIIFISPIKKGSVSFQIFNELNYEIHLGNLQENNLITIYSEPNINNYLVNKLEKNIIIIKKIKMKNNYIFNSESSEEINDL